MPPYPSKFISEISPKYHFSTSKHCSSPSRPLHLRCRNTHSHLHKLKIGLLQQHPLRPSLYWPPETSVRSELSCPVTHPHPLQRTHYPRSPKAHWLPIQYCTTSRSSSSPAKQVAHISQISFSHIAPPVVSDSLTQTSSPPSPNPSTVPWGTEPLP